MSLTLVVMESPYAGDIERNVRYARACLRDCLDRGEAPIASHLLYTQPGVLDDADPDQRTLGIAAGIAWARCAKRAVFYTDLGWSPGMMAARRFYEERCIQLEERSLGARMGRLNEEPTPERVSPSIREALHQAHDPDRIWVQWSECGQHIRRWQRTPFEGGAAYAR